MRRKPIAIALVLSVLFVGVAGADEDPKPDEIPPASDAKASPAKDAEVTPAKDAEANPAKDAEATPAAPDGEAPVAPEGAPPAASDAKPSPIPELKPIPAQDKETTIPQYITRYGVLVGTPAVVVGYGMGIWKWGDRGARWSWGNEGWFGRDTGHGGMDKVGHAFGCYLTTRWAYAAFDYSEGDHWTKYLYSSLLGTLVGVGIEIGDAYTAKYGFSVNDIVANMVGVGLGVLLDAVPEVGAFVGFSMQYWPTQAFKNSDKTALDIADDTGGITYHLNFKLAGFEYIGIDIPNGLRYLMFDVGYAARGFARFDQEAGKEPKRYWQLGLSLNVAEVIRTFFDEPHGTAAGLVSKPFEYFQLPIGIKKEGSFD